MNVLFNYAVIINLFLTAVVWIAPVFDSYWLNDAALNLLSDNGWGAFIRNPEFLYWPLFAYWALISGGLLMRVRVARSIFLFGLVVFALLNFGWGFVVLTPVEAGLFNLINLLDGAILAMAYLTSVSAGFTQKRKEQEAVDAPNR